MLGGNLLADWPTMTCRHRFDLRHVHLTNENRRRRCFYREGTGQPSAAGSPSARYQAPRPRQLTMPEKRRSLHFPGLGVWIDELPSGILAGVKPAINRFGGPG